MDGLQAVWDHPHHDQSSPLLWSNFANNKLIVTAEEEEDDDFFLSPIPEFFHSNTHKGQASVGNPASSLIMASPAGFGTGVDGSTEESLDCLLTSASNSHTATTATTTTTSDDDSISLIFSSAAGNFWNTTAPLPPPPPPLLPSLPAAVSSGDSSENYNKSAAGKRKSITKMDTGGKKKSSHLPLAKVKKPRHSYTSATSSSDNRHNSSNNISFQQQPTCLTGYEEPDQEAIAQMKEMIYRAACFRPVNIGGEEAERPKRKNVRISKDPQTVAARQRRERISERIRVLQRLVPGGNKMDTASMLDEAANYLKFLRSQVKALENVGGHSKTSTSPSPSASTLLQTSFPLVVPTNLTFSPSMIPTTNYAHQSNGGNILSGSGGGMVLPMQTQNNLFPSLLLQNPSTHLLYPYHHHQPPHHQV